MFGKRYSFRREARIVTKALQEREGRVTGPCMKPHAALLGGISFYYCPDCESLLWERAEGLCCFQCERFHRMEDSILVAGWPGMPHQKETNPGGDR